MSTMAGRISRALACCGSAPAAAVGLHADRGASRIVAKCLPARGPRCLGNVRLPHLPFRKRCVSKTRREGLQSHNGNVYETKLELVCMDRLRNRVARCIQLHSVFLPWLLVTAGQLRVAEL